MTRRETPLDAHTVVGSLAEHDVDAVVIGGLAAQAHGSVRTTQDVDLFPRPDRANLHRLVQALNALNARPAGTGSQSISSRLDVGGLEAATVLALDTPAGGVDIHRSPPGAQDYDAVRSRAMVLEISGVTVAFAGLDDLIAMKRASGRPIDLADIASLTRDEA